MQLTARSRPLLVAAVACCLTGAGLWSSSAEAAVSFERVDLLSEAPGTWLHYEAPSLPSYPVRPLLRFVEQLQVIMAIDASPKVQVGVSLASIDLAYQDDVPGIDWANWRVGLSTRLLMPRGAFASVGAQLGRWRIGVGLNAMTAATWSRPGGIADVGFLPTLSIGVGGAKPAP